MCVHISQLGMGTVGIRLGYNLLYEWGNVVWLQKDFYLTSLKYSRL